MPTILLSARYSHDISGYDFLNEPQSGSDDDGTFEFVSYTCERIRYSLWMYNIDMSQRREHSGSLRQFSQ